MIDVNIVDDATDSKTVDDVTLRIFSTILREELSERYHAPAIERAISGTAKALTILEINEGPALESWFFRKVLEASKKVGEQGDGE